MNINYLSKTLLTLSLLMGTYFMSLSQFDAGADFATRYLWRGQLLAQGAVLQPWVSFSGGTEKLGYEIGAWGSYGFNGNDGTESDIYASVTSGTFTFTFTDYFFPTDNQFAASEASDDYFQYGKETGHVFEFGAGFDGIDNFPISLGIYFNFAGADKENSIYTKLAYAANEQLEFYMEAGNGWYTLEEADATDKFDVVSFGLTYSKEIKFSENFTLPIYSTFALNPNLEKPFIAFGISF